MVMGSKTLTYEIYSIYNKNFSNNFQTANGFCLYELEDYKSYIIQQGYEKSINVEIDNSLTITEKFLNKCSGRVTGISTQDLSSDEFKILYVPGNSSKIFSNLPIFTIFFLFFNFIIFQIFKKIKLNYDKKYLIYLLFCIFASFYILRLINFDEINLYQKFITDPLYIINPQQSYLSFPIYFFIFFINYLLINKKSFFYIFNIFIFFLLSGLIFRIFYLINLSPILVLVSAAFLFYKLIINKLKQFSNSNLKEYEFSTSTKIISSTFLTYINIFILNRDFYCLDTDCEVYHFLIPKLIESNINTSIFPYAEIGYGLSQAYSNIYPYTLSFIQQITNSNYLTIGYFYQILTLYVFLMSILFFMKKIDIDEKWLSVILLLFLANLTIVNYLMPGNYVYLLISLLILRICFQDSNRIFKLLLEVFIFMIGPLGILCLAILYLHDFKNIKVNILKGFLMSSLHLVVNLLSGYPFLYPYSNIFLDDANKSLYNSTTAHLKLNNLENLNFYNFNFHNILFGHPRLINFGLVTLLCVGAILYLNRSIKGFQFFKFMIYFLTSYNLILFFLGYFFDRYYIITNVFIILLVIGLLNMLTKQINNKIISTFVFCFFLLISIFAPNLNLYKNEYVVTEEFTLFSIGRFNNYFINNDKELEFNRFIRSNYSIFSSKFANILTQNNYKVMYGDLRILHLDNINDYSFLFSDVAYKSYRDNSNIWDVIEDNEIDFSILPFWTFADPDIWPVLTENSYYKRLDEKKLYTFKFCSIDFEAFMLVDHKNNFQELLDQDITKEFCWENKPMKRYLNSFDSN